MGERTLLSRVYANVAPVGGTRLLQSLRYRTGMDQNALQAKLAEIKDLTDRGMMMFASDRLAELVEACPDVQAVRLAQLAHLTKIADYYSAGQAAKDLLEEFPDDLPVRQHVLDALVPAGLYSEAMETVDWLLTQPGANPHLLCAKADVLERTDRLDEAREVVERYRSLPVAQPQRLAQRDASLAMAEKRYEDARRVLEDHLGGDEEERLAGPMKGLQIELYFMLAKVCDRSGDYDAAWAASTTAHELDGTPWRQQDYDAIADNLQKIVSRDLLPHLGRGTNESCEPLLILGNARSGTTMLDQILSMHPDAAAGGELFVTAEMVSKLSRVTDSYHPYPQSLLDIREEEADVLGAMYENIVSAIGPGKRYVSNKSLALQFHAPLVTMCLPKTRLINLHRYPLDNIVSCYTMNLVANNHFYTNRIEDLAQAWVTRRRIQDYWQETIDVPIHELHYESMVADQEGETRRLLDFLDLPWHDGCLEFHKSKNVARTISRDQVSRPMYTTSKGRWRNYEKHLEPIFGILEDYL